MEIESLDCYADSPVDCPLHYKCCNNYFSSTMIRAIESRDLVMSQFPADFFPKPKVTDLLRECAVTDPVQRQNIEAAIMRYCHRGTHKEGEKTAIIGKFELTYRLYKLQLFLSISF